ncbi:CDP-alcohol phosphatidyltransferase family protein [Novosphingobium beihaiensis]|uniref:CDP-alcohol phosphatidyltransferase family protein n=1 Tax=Novosphingobium beihaiensis TaxID=2930389 RepID=A0ABT0BN24_9SPHN|nr:CDP-alcohol phosphatidyltransferase family protein [Novosphingobium beihaiensis]MCJ2186445.1 CDP-alcohol phosphatidyltransferase family protein [Novosphingobium beihaiensis]
MKPKFADLFTIYRIAAAPVAAGVALAGHRDAFFILIILSLASDLVDGPIARWCNQASETGAKLDTIADAATVLAAIAGLWLFEAGPLRSEWPWLGLFLASYGAAAIACLVKFRVLPAYHLYLSKAGALCSGAFIVSLYFLGYSRLFFLALVVLGVAANVESLLVTFRLRRFRPDVGSLLRLKAADRDGNA